ncbi:MAG: hypothetical protein FJX62_09950 [Alphaproteobacteria bacterium]|nr:hypothetical protein [Alphaproteobacteria bacterium]
MDVKPAHSFAALRRARLSADLRALAAACVFLFTTASGTHAQGAGTNCEEAAGLAILASPIAPWKGAPLRVVFTVEQPLDGELALIAPDGSVAARSNKRHGGPPYFWFAEVASPAAGKWQARLTRDGAPDRCGTLTREIAVQAAAPARPAAREGIVWPLRASWNRTNEALFSAWIEKLFDDPLDAAPSWQALHFVLRDRSRNILFNHLGLGEDEMKTVLRPDCADLPYFLRAYFAFKMGLPFGYSICTRGGGGRAPRCTAWYDIRNLEPPPPQQQQAAAALPPPPAAPRRAPLPLDNLFGRSNEPESAAPAQAAPKPVSAPPKRLGLVAGFADYARQIGGGVHSGSARTALADNNTDYYPVRLTQDTLRPGTVYADPYGHILMIVRRVPQTADAAGIILAVDGQPDGTVARKRFWRGNFLFAQDPALGGPGFKRFRPVVAGKDGALRRLSNEEIAKHSQYGDFALDQGKLSIEDFYDRMDDVMSPQPLEPRRAMLEAITSLEEQVKTRVTSVENGRKWQAGSRGDANMPNGAAIFETTGAWEDFSTPSRDLRLLIAMDVVTGFPDRVARRPDRYAMPQGKGPAEVKAELQSVLASELASRKFTYPRSDGSPWTLALKDAIERVKDLEMAYNPNDCVELRWGAPAKSEEASTCKRYAPQAQRTKMAQYRPWFAERRRPPRP